VRDRLANERDTEADERERIADERDRIADERDAEADERERIMHRDARARSVQQDLADVRIEAARVADWMADQADAFAAYLEEHAGGRAGEERKLAFAESEREIATVLRRNADNLRSARGALRLERIPRLPSPWQPTAQTPTDGDG
jgi:hypothetical protein